MRFHSTIEHHERKSAWEEAYKAHDGFAEAGDDGERFGGSPEADAASAAEYAALEAYVGSPSVTTIEMLEKIELLKSREMLIYNMSNEQPMEQLERDLVNMVRPNASAGIAAAFTTWADAQEAWFAKETRPDDECDQLGEAVTAAEKALMHLPCFTPGDFIVKAYVDMMRDTGAEGVSGFGPFFPDEAALHRYDERIWRDILASDLGCCMAALGRADFDAARWVDACKRHQKGVTLMRSDKGRSLSLDMTGPHNIMTDTLQRLTANGLRIVSDDRCRAIAQEIEAHHPDLIHDVRQTVAA